MSDLINELTAEQKVAIVLDIWQGKTTAAAASQTNNLAPSEITGWINDAKRGMENALRGTAGGTPQQPPPAASSGKKPEERIKIGVTAKQLRVTSEPYPVLTGLGFAVAVAVLDIETQQPYELMVGSKSLSKVLSSLAEGNDNRFTGLEFRVKKESDQKMAKYVVET